MSVSDRLNSDDKQDKMHFEELDGYTNGLRKAAQDFADFLTPFDNKSNEITDLIKTLKMVNKLPIEEMDKGINAINKSFLSISINDENNNPFFKSLDQQTLKNFFNKQEELISQATRLVEKAIEINQKSF